MDMFTYNLNHFFIIMCDFADLLIVSTHKHVMMFTLTVHHLTIAPFYQFPVQSQLFTPKSLLFTPISRANWGSTLCKPFVIRTSQWQQRCVRLPTPLLAKGVLPFSLT